VTVMMMMTVSQQGTEGNSDNDNFHLLAKTCTAVVCCQLSMLSSSLSSDSRPTSHIVNGHRSTMWFIVGALILTSLS